MLTQTRLKELMHYNPDTGVFTWRVDFRKAKAGEVVGSNHDGYLRVSIDQVRYYLHRLAFLYMTGEMPVNLVDHEHRTRRDNRWEKLREANKQQNAGNSIIPSTNTSGFKGVSFCKFTNRWRASIRINGVEKNLGRYGTPEEAHEAYLAAAEIAFGAFAFGGVTNG